MSKAPARVGRFIVFATALFTVRATSTFLRILQSSSQRSRWVSTTRRLTGRLKVHLPEREIFRRRFHSSTRTSYVEVLVSRNREKPPAQSPAKIWKRSSSGSDRCVDGIQ